MQQELQQYCVRDTATIMSAIAQIQTNNSRCVIVMNEHEKVIGMFSEGDVLRAILAGTDVYTQLCHIIKPSFYFLKMHDLQVAREWIVSGITLIPIIDEEYHLTDVMTIKDIF